MNNYNNYSHPYQGSFQHLYQTGSSVSHPVDPARNVPGNAQGVATKRDYESKLTDSLPQGYNPLFGRAILGQGGLSEEVRPAILGQGRISEGVRPAILGRAREGVRPAALFGDIKPLEVPKDPNFESAIGTQGGVDAHPALTLQDRGSLPSSANLVHANSSASYGLEEFVSSSAVNASSFFVASAVAAFSGDWQTVDKPIHSTSNIKTFYRKEGGVDRATHKLHVNVFVEKDDIQNDTSLTSTVFEVSEKLQENIQDNVKNLPKEINVYQCLSIDFFLYLQSSTELKTLLGAGMTYSVRAVTGWEEKLGVRTVKEWEEKLCTILVRDNTQKYDQINVAFSKEGISQLMQHSGFLPDYMRVLVQSKEDEKAPMQIRWTYKKPPCIFVYENLTSNKERIVSFFQRKSFLAFLQKIKKLPQLKLLEYVQIHLLPENASEHGARKFRFYWKEGKFTVERTGEVV